MEVEDGHDRQCRARPRHQKQQQHERNTQHLTVRLVLQIRITSTNDVSWVGRWRQRNGTVVERSVTYIIVVVGCVEWRVREVVAVVDHTTDTHEDDDVDDGNHDNGWVKREHLRFRF